MEVNRANDIVDCSSAQEDPHPDIGKYARAGHKQLIHKVSEGVGYHWNYGDTINAQGHDHGLVMGHYHWLRPDSDATAQAHYFMTLVERLLKPGDWLMVDYEWP